nr:MAG TPA: hypothetical protein [Caudoviricetes sp.]
MKVRVEQLLGKHSDWSVYQDTIHLTGTVDWQGRKNGAPLYGVIFEELKNPAGKNGRFYYTECELALFEEEEDMKEFDWTDYKVASCIVEDKPETQNFAIANFDVENVRAIGGDAYGVTETNRVVNIITILDGQDLHRHEGIGSAPREELKAVFNGAPYRARQERRKKKAELKKQMDQRVKEIQATQIYEMLAEKDEALADMLKAFKEV